MSNIFSLPGQKTDEMELTFIFLISLIFLISDSIRNE